MTGKPTTGTLRGTSAADVLIATADGQAVLGLGGDDVLVSLYNHTKLSGGDGNDALTGRATARNGFPEATSRLIGGNGDDAMLASANANGFSHATARTVLNGGDGEDTLTATARANANGGADAINELHGGLGGDSLTAEAEASSISPDSSAVNTIHAGAGDDILVAKSAANGAQGGGEAANSLFGDDGNDTITRTPKAAMTAPSTISTAAQAKIPSSPRRRSVCGEAGRRATSSMARPATMG